MGYALKRGVSIASAQVEIRFNVIELGNPVRNMSQSCQWLFSMCLCKSDGNL